MAELAGRQLAIHRVHLNSGSDALAKTATFDSVTGRFRIPPRTTVVFVAP